jgi:GT2 family glycosyltransferase
MKIAVVIPNFNGKELLGACLESLLVQSLTPHIIVVDNGSTDGSASFIQQQYSKLELIQLNSNLGFAGGVNAGIKSAIKNGFEFVALFNNDAVADSNWLKFLVEKINQDPKVGIVASKILASDQKTIDSTGEEYSTWGTPFPRGRGEVDKNQYDSTSKQTIFAASGGASIYRVAMLQKIGLFDELFFAYYEDVDISFRARLNGWQVQYASKAVVYHAMNVTANQISSSFADYHKLKNYVFLYVKNMPGKLFWQHFLTFAAGFWGRTLTLALQGKGLIVFKALVVIGLRKPQIFFKRYQVQKLRTVPTKDIEQLLYKHPSPNQSKRLLKSKK